MVKFLLEKKNNISELFDFEFILLKSLGYMKWSNPLEDYLIEYIEFDKLIYLDKSYNEFIPIGNLKFIDIFSKVVHLGNKEPIKEILSNNSISNEDKLNKIYYLKSVIPLNVPDFLNCFSGIERDLRIVSKEDVINLKNVYIKSIERYKGDSNLNHLGFWDKNNFEEDFYLVSNLIDIDCEYRVFVLNDNILDIKMYVGNWDCYNLLDLSIVSDVVKTIKNNRNLEDFPLCYTLDFYINNNKTYLMEVHPFVSCGLYGFNDLSKIFNMFIFGYKYYLNNLLNKY